MLTDGIAAQFHICFPINAVNIEHEESLIFLRQIVEIINRFIRLTDPLSLQKITIFPHNFLLF